MSVFRVKLSNTQQGLMDRDPSTASAIAVGGAQGDTYLGDQMDPSIQRSITVAGPHRIQRHLADGETFTDCNYWKRFAYPQVPLDQAFIEVVTDDGSVWSDFSGENNYALTFGGDTDYDVLTTDTFDDNVIDLIGTYGSYATFVQITNNGTTAYQDIKVQLNGSSSAVFALKAGETQVFNTGDLSISQLAFQGGTDDTTIQVVLSLTTQCNT